MPVKVLLLLVMMGWQTVALADEPEPPLKDRLIIIASINNFPPFSDLNAKGDFVGFWREVSSAVITEMGGRVDYIHTPIWDEVVTWLAKGDAEVIHDTPLFNERASAFLHSTPILESYEKIFVRDSQQGISSLEDLRGRDVACIEDTSSKHFLKNYPGINCQFVKTPMEGMVLLIHHDVDAFVYPELIIHYLALKLHLGHQLKEVGEPLRKVTWSMIVKRGDQELLDILNEGIERIKSSGQYDRIYKDWFGSTLFTGYSTTEVQVFSSFVAIAFLLIGLTIGLGVYNRKLTSRDRQLMAIMNSTIDGIMVINQQGIIVSANPSIEAMFGYSREEMVGSNITMLMDQDVARQHDKFLGSYHSGKESNIIGQVVEVMGRRKSGELFALELTVSDTSIKGNIYFTGIMRDVTARKAMAAKLEEAMKAASAANAQLQQSNEELLYLSQHDGLTGLANRRYLDDFMEREWHRLARQQQSLSVILLDVDYFKVYNDIYGHQLGDECLIKVAKVLSTQVHRSSDMAARYGGEEFIVVLPDTGLDGAYHMAEKIRGEIERLSIHHSGSKSAEFVTVSAGVAACTPNLSKRSETVIADADQALYRAKKTGRNRVVRSE